MTKTALEQTATQIEAKQKCPICGSPQISGFLTAPDRFHLRTEEYRLLRCSRCGCVWLDNPPKPEEMGFHYSEKYHRTITLGGGGGASRWQSHRDIIARYRQGGSILDVGCNSGAFLSSMKDGNWKLHGIEMDAMMAEKARMKTGAEVYVGDVMDSPFKANSFDVITCFDVLEHVYHPREFLQQMLQLLKPGGIFFARLPNIESWEAKLFGSYWYGLELPRHLYHFSPRSLSYLAADLGCEEFSVGAKERGSHLGHSVRYLWGNFIEKMGFTPSPMADLRRPNLAWRIVRKALMTSTAVPLAYMSSAAGASVFMDLILKKQAGNSVDGKTPVTGA